MTSSYSEKVMKVKTALENIFLKKNIGSSNGDKNIVTDSNGNIVTEDKPSYTPTITSATSSSYVVGTLNLNGTDEIIYGKDVNSNTLGFQIRTNSMEITPTDKTYRYRLLLQTGDNNKYMPVNTSTSTAHNTSKTSTMNTREFLLGGDIRYYSGSTAIAVGSVFSATNVMQQYNITLGYSFNNTYTDLTLSDNIPVYMVVQQSSTNPSMAKLASPFYTQTLPNTEDGLLYVQLGYATAATTMELTLDHPIFHYKDGKVQLFSPNNHTHSQYSTFTGNYNDLTNKPTIPSASSTTPSADTANGSVGSGTTWAKADHTHPKSTLYAEASHSHSYNDLSNKPTIPLATSDLTNDGNGEEPFLTHSDISAVGITNNYGDLDNKPTIPSASSTTPSADVSGGAIGTGTTWAKADHQHPLSSAYATSGHNHDVKDLNDTTNILTNIAHTSDLTNFLTASDISAVGLSNNYEDLNNLPYLPTATSDFMNDGSGGGEVYIETDSNTNGLIKNDGTIDTTILTHSHGNLSNDGKIGSNANYFVYTTTGGAVTSKQKIGNINTSGAIGSTSGLPLKTTTNGVITTGAFGTSSGQFAEGNHTHSQYASIEDIPTHLEDLTLSDDEGISSEDGHLLINNRTSGDYIGFADDLLTYDTANSVLNYNAYELATVNDIPTTTSQLTNNSGFLTSHQSLTPTRVYNCTSWNSTYIDTSATNKLMLYKLGDSLYFLRYFLTTKTLTYSTTDYNINSDSINNDYRPAGDRTFYVATNKEANAKMTVKSTGKITISASSNNQVISTAGTVVYWW